METKRSYPRVLAIDPKSRGFGFTVFEQPDRIIDWGTSEFRVRLMTRSQMRLDKLIDHYKPNVLVIENTNAPSSRRGKTAKKMLTQFAQKAVASMIPVKRYSRDNIKEVFSEFGVTTKEEIADHLVEWLPALAVSRPPKRAIWDKEHDLMSVFDAASLAMVFYAEQAEGAVPYKK